jgi:acetoin:2,6-dichlorophenolindophenol oxidoreductase subunit alpha
MQPSRDACVDIYRQMVLIRHFEELALSLREQDRIHGVVHPYSGQEAIAVGVCANLRTTDKIVSNHRGHGHCIAKGADIKRMMAELFGRRDGYSKGKGGSMHIADFDVGMLGANGIVGAGLPIAAGAAVAAQLEGSDAVSVAFFGDGATGEGPFHESLNIAALLKLPVIWVCENNQYAADTPVEAGLSARHVADSRARAGEGPTLLECVTWRQHIHAQRDVPPPDRRPSEQKAYWEARDPLPRFERYLREHAILTDDQMADIGLSIDGDLEDAVAFADASPYPAPEEALEDVFA